MSNTCSVPSSTKDTAPAWIPIMFLRARGPAAIETSAGRKAATVATAPAEDLRNSRRVRLEAVAFMPPFWAERRRQASRIIPGQGQFTKGRGHPYPRDAGQGEAETGGQGCPRPFPRG